MWARFLLQCFFTSLHLWEYWSVWHPHSLPKVPLVGVKERFELSAPKIKTPLYSLPLNLPYHHYIVQGNKGNHLFLWQKPGVGKRFDLSVQDAICLEKARGWGLIALAIEWGCQLASSDNCFPWQDPGGQGKRSTEWRRGAGIHFHLIPVIIVLWARGYLLPICVRAKFWLTPIDQRDWKEGKRGGLEYRRDCHSKN